MNDVYDVEPMVSSIVQHGQTPSHLTPLHYTGGTLVQMPLWYVFMHMPST